MSIKTHIRNLLKSKGKINKVYQGDPISVDTDLNHVERFPADDEHRPNQVVYEYTQTDNKGQTYLK